MAEPMPLLYRELLEKLREAEHFRDFVLRHTLPERARARTPEETHSIIAHHPFAKKSA